MHHRTRRRAPPRGRALQTPFKRAPAPSPPPRRAPSFGLVYGILVVLGIGTLLPWNVMITEKEFFDVRLHVEPANARIANNFMSLFGLTFNTL